MHTKATFPKCTYGLHPLQAEVPKTVIWNKCGQALLCTSSSTAEMQLFCTHVPKKHLLKQLWRNFEWWLSWSVKAYSFYKCGTEGYFMLLLRSSYNQNTEWKQMCKVIICNSSENSKCFRRYMQVIFVDIIQHMNNSLWNTAIIYK